jgi:hypothetical protein
MRTVRASDDDIKAFMMAIFPDGAALAMAVFDERSVLQEATRLIQGLRDAVTTLEQTNAQCQHQLAAVMAGQAPTVTLKRIDFQDGARHVLDGFSTGIFVRPLVTDTADDGAIRVVIHSGRKRTPLHRRPDWV